MPRPEVHRPAAGLAVPDHPVPAASRLRIPRRPGRDDQLRHWGSGRPAAGTCGPAPTPPRPAGNPCRAGQRWWSRRSGRSGFPPRRRQDRAGKKGQRCCRGSRCARTLTVNLLEKGGVPFGRGSAASARAPSGSRRHGGHAALPVSPVPSALVPRSAGRLLHLITGPVRSQVHPAGGQCRGADRYGGAAPRGRGGGRRAAGITRSAEG
jgi:hypothetical protein